MEDGMRRPVSRRDTVKFPIGNALEVQKETGMKNNSSSEKQKMAVVQVERREKTPLENSNSSAKQRKPVKAVKEFGEQKLFAMAATGRGGSDRVTIGLDLGDRSS